MRLRRKILVAWLLTSFFLIVVTITLNAHAEDFDDGEDDNDVSLYGMPRLAKFLISKKQKNRLKRSVRERQKRRESLTEGKTQYILLYNDLLGAKDWGLGLGDQLFKGLQCPVSNCALIWGRSKMKDSSAVMFNVPQLNPILPKIRPNGQTWIFFSLESPEDVPRLPDQWRGRFNWSMSYNQRSDFQISFGQFAKRQYQLHRNWTELVQGKAQMVAWFLSNCESSSRRMDYVKRLQKIVPVDIYGKCSGDECPNGNKEQCEEMLNTSYKFYLTFENSICEDYITEKAFQYSKSEITIDIRDDEDSAYMPPNSFINAGDFSTPEDLGHFLLYLDQNPREHARYLEWKNEWDVREQGLSQDVWCDLCKSLHRPHRSSIYGDPYDLWFNRNQCLNAPHFGK